MQRRGSYDDKLHEADKLGRRPVYCRVENMQGGVTNACAVVSYIVRNGTEALNNNIKSIYKVNFNYLAEHTLVSYSYRHSQLAGVNVILSVHGVL